MSERGGVGLEGLERARGSSRRGGEDELVQDNEAAQYLSLLSFFFGPSSRRASSGRTATRLDRSFSLAFSSLRRKGENKLAPCTPSTTHSILLRSHAKLVAPPRRLEPAQASPPPPPNSISRRLPAAPLAGQTATRRTGRSNQPNSRTCASHLSLSVEAERKVKRDSDSLHSKRHDTRLLAHAHTIFLWKTASIIC